MAFLKALTSFAGATASGMQVDVVEGRTYRDDHPAVAGREHLFEPLDDGAPEAPRAPRPRSTGTSKTA